MKAWRVSAAPMVVSLILSACTVGTRPYWEDSGVYLTAVKEFGVLYPHGFALYLCLCKAWTLLLGFVDFTLAVHLFSSVCAALAAGILARAAERMTGDRLASALCGCLAAAGYTWWFAGIFAKVYALLYVLVALILWRMTCRDVVGTLIASGLAWAAHPSAGLLGPAVLVFLLRHRTEIRALGVRRATITAAAAVLAALGPSVLLPVLAGKDTVYAMGHPASFREWVRYISGRAYTSIPGVWGFAGIRWAHLGLYFWEEFLAVGLLLVGLGGWRMVRERREELWLLPLWILPLAVTVMLFKIEGQYDFWLVSVWMPLWIVAAFGLAWLRSQARAAAVAAAAGGLLWAALANGKDLYLRGVDGPESLGRCLLENLDPGSVLVVSTDDPLALCWYLQTVRGYRQDVRVVMGNLVTPQPQNQWYLDRIGRLWPGFRRPEFGLLASQASRYTALALSQAAIVNGQGQDSRPVFFDSEPAPQLFNRGAVVPAGFLWKWTPEAASAPDPRYWSYPVSLEQIAPAHGRKRAQLLSFTDDNVFVYPQAYDDRFVYFLAEALRNEGDLYQRTQTPDGFARSVEAYRRILRSVPSREKDPQILYPLGLDLFVLDRHGEAAPLFARLLETDAGPLMKAGAYFYLGEMHGASRRPDEAQECYRQALKLAPAGSPLRVEIERRLRGS